MPYHSLNPSEKSSFDSTNQSLVGQHKQAVHMFLKKLVSPQQEFMHQKGKKQLISSSPSQSSYITADKKSESISKLGASASLNPSPSNKTTLNDRSQRNQNQISKKLNSSGEVRKFHLKLPINKQKIPLTREPSNDYSNGSNHKSQSITSLSSYRSSPNLQKLMDPVRTNKRKQLQKRSPDLQHVINIISNQSGMPKQMTTMLNAATCKNSPTKSNRTTQHNTPNKDKFQVNSNNLRSNQVSSANTDRQSIENSQGVSMSSVIKSQYDHKHKFQNKPPQYNNQKIQRNKINSQGCSSSSSSSSMSRPLNRQSSNRFNIGKPSLSTVNSSPGQQNEPRKTINSCSKFTSVQQSKEKARKMLNLRDSQASVTEGYNVPRDTKQIIQPRASSYINEESREDDDDDCYDDINDDNTNDTNGMKYSPVKTMISRQKNNEPFSKKPEQENFYQQLNNTSGIENKQSQVFSIPSSKSQNNRCNSTHNSQRRNTKGSVSSTIPRNYQFNSSQKKIQMPPPKPFQAHFNGAITPNLDIGEDDELIDNKTLKIQTNKLQEAKNLQQNMESQSMLNYSQLPHQIDLTHIQEMKSALFRLSQQKIGAQQQVEVLNTRMMRAKSNVQNSKKQILRMRSIISDLKQNRMRTVKQNNSLKTRLKQTTNQLSHALQNMLVLLEFFQESNKIFKQCQEDDKLLQEFNQDNNQIKGKKNRDFNNLQDIFTARLQNLINKQGTRLSMISMHREAIEKIIRSNKQLFDKESKLKNLDVSEELSPTDYRQIYSTQAPILKQPRNQISTSSRINRTHILIPASTTNASSATRFRGFQTDRFFQASKRLQFNGNSAITSPQRRALLSRKNLNQSMYCRLGAGGNDLNKETISIMNESCIALKGNQNNYTCSNFNPNSQASSVVGRARQPTQSRSLSSSKQPTNRQDQKQMKISNKQNQASSLLEHGLYQRSYQNSTKKLIKNKDMIDQIKINTNMGRYPTLGQLHQDPTKYQIERNTCNHFGNDYQGGLSQPYEFKTEQCDQQQYIQSYLNENDYQQQKLQQPNRIYSSKQSYKGRLASLDSEPQIASERRNTKMQFYPTHNHLQTQSQDRDSINTEQINMIKQIQNQKKIEQKNNEIAQHLKKIQNLQKNIESNLKQITQLNDKIKLMEQALCRANLQRQSTNIKLENEREQNASLLKQTQELLNQEKQQNNKLHTELQFAQQRIYSYQAVGVNTSTHSTSSFSPDKTKIQLPPLRTNQMNSSGSEVSTVVAGANSNIHRSNAEQIIQLQNQIQELTIYKNKYISSKEAISNLLTALFSKFQQYQSKAQSSKASTPDLFTTSNLVGQKQRDLLESLLGQSNFNFISNINNQMNQIESDNLRLKKRALDQYKKEIQLIQNLVDTYGGLAKIGQAFNSNNQAELTDIKKELIQQIQPLSQARNKKLKQKEKLQQNYRRKKKQMIIQVEQSKAKSQTSSCKNADSNNSSSNNMLEYLIPNNRESQPPSVRGYDQTSIDTDTQKFARNSLIKEVSEDDQVDSNNISKKNRGDSKIIIYEDDDDDVKQNGLKKQSSNTRLANRPKIIEQGSVQNKIFGRQDRISKYSNCSSQSSFSQDQNFSLQIDYETLENSKISVKNANTDTNKNSIAEQTRRMASPDFDVDKERIARLTKENQYLKEKIKQLEKKQLQEEKEKSSKSKADIKHSNNHVDNPEQILNEDLLHLLEIQSVQIQKMLQANDKSIIDRDQ